MTMIKCICSFCKESFLKELRQYNQNKKRGMNFFCSKKCVGKHMAQQTKYISLKCRECGNKFKKLKSEHKRSTKLKRNHFCSRSCATAFGNRSTPRGNTPTRTPNELSPFRYYVLRAKSRQTKKGKTNLTPEYLKKIWESQNGQCVGSGVKMILPESCERWPQGEKWKHASLDRIDHNKGYIKGNVRFVCHIYNVARHRYTDEEVLNFCNLVTKNRAPELVPCSLSGAGGIEATS